MPGDWPGQTPGWQQPATAPASSWRENIGFSLILLINWAAGIIRLPQLHYGDPVDFNWLRGLIKRLHRLEESMLVCSFGREGRWLAMEQYFDPDSGARICPECSQQARDRPAQQIAEAPTKD